MNYNIYTQMCFTNEITNMLCIIYGILLTICKWCVYCKFVYVGSYGPPWGIGKGIYVYDTNSNWSLVQLMETESPTYLTMNAKGDRLYSTNELNHTLGRVSAFAVDQSNGKLTFINTLPTLGSLPCYVVLDPTEKYLLTANYESGSVSIFSLDHNGGLANRTQVYLHQGCGPNKVRQSTPHAHMIYFPRNCLKHEEVLVVDLGMDQILYYHFDRNCGKIIDNYAKTPHIWMASPGSGPRHFTMSSAKNYLYVINELFATISVFPYKLGTKVPPILTVSTLPSEMCNVGSNSEIKFHPNEMFLYAANRFNDLIAVFKVDHNSGQLMPIRHYPTLGKTPRHFQIEDDKMFIGNQDSNTITVFNINSVTGTLNSTGQVIDTPSPTFILFQN